MSLITNILFDFLCRQKKDNNETNNVLKKAPTAENIDIVIDFNYWNLLTFLFPSTFKNKKEAYDFYNVFIEKAMQTNENKIVYELPEKIHINFKLDMCSGLVIAKNLHDSNSEVNHHFFLLPLSDIKNDNLKSEILKIYEDNYEHLKKLGIVGKYGDGRIFNLTHFVINENGLFKNTYWAPDYCADSDNWDKETQNFSLPIKTLINFFRKIETNYQSLTEDEIKKYVSIQEQNYNEFNCKINVDKYEVEIENDIFSIFIKVKYYYPAQDIINSSEEPNLPYKTIEF